MPTPLGQPDHLVPGDIVPIELAVFDVIKLLPLRSLRISFPGAFETAEDIDDHLVQFDGMFGLNPSDPFTLWKFLLGRAVPEITQSSIVSVNNDSTASTTGPSIRASPVAADRWRRDGIRDPVPVHPGPDRGVPQWANPAA